MKGIIRYTTVLETGMSFSSADRQEIHYNIGGFISNGNDGFAEGQRVVITVEAIEEPSA